MLVPSGLLPTYLSEAFSQLYEEDGLLVLGKGLGIMSLLATFVRFYGDVEEGYNSEKAIQLAGAKKAPLVFVLGLRDDDNDTLLTILQGWGTPPEQLPTIVTNETGQGKDREVLYARGGVFCVTSRILIVDLLTNVAKARDIDGLLVYRAELVTEESTEAFILRICHTQKHLVSRNQCEPLFVKAFSESPDQLLSGFSKVEKILKSLRVRQSYLYPRFHSIVVDELQRRPPHVEEFHQELSPRMKQIQSAIAAAVHTCIRELKATTNLLEWTDAELSVENCVTSRFDMAISRQLEGDWHRLKPQTKQLVQDLRTLRTLFQYLIQYDAVSFWKLLNSLKTISAASRYPSMWLLTPAADMIFRLAKERLYQITNPFADENNPPPVAKLKPVLEANPKWVLLTKILQEIKKDSSKLTTDSGKILIVVKDKKTLDSVGSYLRDGKERTLATKWLRFLETQNDKSRSLTKRRAESPSFQEESRLLLEEESRVRRFLFGGSSKSTCPKVGQKTRSPLNAMPLHSRKRRRVAAETGRGRISRTTDDIDRTEVLGEALEQTEISMKTTRTEGNRGQFDFQEKDSFFRVHKLELQQVVIKTSSDGGDRALLQLQEMKPSFVILFDVDLPMIRALEVYSCLQSSEEAVVRVFLMLYGASAEEKVFLKTLDREKEAFERLIHMKKTMPTPMMSSLVGTQEIQQACATESYADGTLPLAYDSRKGVGKQQLKKDKRDIVVDVREFRSALPSVLHRAGMRLAPVTLTVGDFVLSSVHCVERKSISDLYGSFTSGRLYLQAEAMTKFYKCACLLIEFDPGKSFSLQNVSELGVEIRSESITSKMVVLIMHFPKLRILWSRGPSETVRIFKALKKNHEEVDVEKAVETARSECEESFVTETRDDNDRDTETNENARRMLLSLPGITVQSARKIMESCTNLADLACMSRDELKKVAGPVTGQKLFGFFYQKMGAL